jgi:hypothetical protein
VGDIQPQMSRAGTVLDDTFVSSGVVLSSGSVVYRL